MRSPAKATPKPAASGFFLSARRAREKSSKPARSLRLHLIENGPGRAGLEFAQNRPRHFIVHRGDLSVAGLLLHLGVNGDEVVACQIKTRVSLSHPFPN